MTDLSVLTLGEAADFLPGLRGDRRIPVLEMYRLAVSERLDDLCGPIVVRPVTEVHQVTRTLVLDHAAYGALTSMSVRVGTGTTAVDLTQVYVDPIGVVEWPYHAFNGTVTVTYTAGRYATTADVTSRFKLAAGLLLQATWRPSESGGSQTYGDTLPGIPSSIPDDVLAILGSEVRAPAVA